MGGRKNRKKEVAIGERRFELRTPMVLTRTGRGPIWVKWDGDKGYRIQPKWRKPRSCYREDSQNDGKTRASWRLVIAFSPNPNQPGSKPAAQTLLLSVLNPTNSVSHLRNIRWTTNHFRAVSQLFTWWLGAERRRGLLGDLTEQVAARQLRPPRSRKAEGKRSSTKSATVGSAYMKKEKKKEDEKANKDVLFWYTM